MGADASEREATAEEIEKMKAADRRVAAAGTGVNAKPPTMGTPG